MVRFIMGTLAGCALSMAVAGETTATRPNIVWISCEDMSMNMGAYGDTVAHSPNLDKLAAQGCTYNRAFSSSPVCSTSRSAIITGMYATTLGTHNHRSMVELPQGVRCFPAYLRDAGYYCTNNAKTDYNFKVPADAWDESSKDAHWRNRRDPNQPFFAVFNLLVTHESKFHLNDKRFAQNTEHVSAADRTSTMAVTLPPYIPDTPITRKDWARDYDMVAEMDYQAGLLLKELDDAGLSTNTIVMFWSDHGVGLPRGKRWLYDSGIQVPLIVRWPGHVAPASRDEELVSLFDLGPTVLSLAGLTPPAAMQSRIFMGEKKQPEPRFLYFTRDRMDETYDMIRAVRGRQYKYIKNFYPEKPYDLVVKYSEQTPTMKELRRLHADGTLTGTATLFFQPRKPAEEFYDTKSDPWEIKNLASDPAFAPKVAEMRDALTAWQKTTGDKGLEPEPESHKRGGKEE